MKMHSQTKGDGSSRTGRAGAFLRARRSDYAQVPPRSFPSVPSVKSVVSFCACPEPTSKNKTLLTIYKPETRNAKPETSLEVTCKIRCDQCGVTFLATVPFPQP